MKLFKCDIFIHTDVNVVFQIQYGDVEKKQIDK